MDKTIGGKTHKNQIAISQAIELLQKSGVDAHLSMYYQEGHPMPIIVMPGLKANITWEDGLAVAMEILDGK